MEIKELIAQVTISVPEGFKIGEESEWKRLANLATVQPLVCSKK